VAVALFGLGLSVLLIRVLAAVVDVPGFAPAIAGLVGIGVGIDYALLILTRYRAALASGGDPRDERGARARSRSARRGRSGRRPRTGQAAPRRPGIAFVGEPRLNAAGTAALVTVVPASSPQDEATVDLVHRLRDEVLPAVEGDGVDVHVGGLTAVVVDQSDLIASRLPVLIAAVVGLSFLFLLVAFRSPLIALKAAVMNLLAVGAAYGVLAVAADGGWFGQLLGIDSDTPVPPFMPVMMFAVLFGLSMDYEVFLLSRIREEYLRHGDTGRAVADGLAKTARVITAAAAIMVVVFLAFLVGDEIFLKLLGVGMATAIFLDATVVRMVLVPALMQLLGRANWWLPRWLDRRLPRFDVERASVVREEA
jgi:RND superfamily putative drug exporter